MIKAVVTFIEYDKESGIEQTIGEQEVKFKHDETFSLEPNKHQLYPGYWVRDFRLFLDCNSDKGDGNIQKTRSSIGGTIKLDKLESDWKKTSNVLVRSLGEIGNQMEDLKNFLGTINTTKRHKKQSKRGYPKKTQELTVEKIEKDVPF